METKVRKDFDSNKGASGLKNDPDDKYPIQCPSYKKHFIITVLDTKDQVYKCPYCDTEFGSC